MTGVWKVPLPFPNRTVALSNSQIGGHHIDLAIMIKITQRQALWIIPLRLINERSVDRGAERSVAVARQHNHTERFAQETETLS